MPIPDVIRPALEAYRESIQRGLPDAVSGVYILGSIALGAFNERFSDIDFLTVLSRPCTENDIRQLEQLHQHIARNYPRWQWQGSYLQVGDLGRYDDTLSPHPHYADGKLHPVHRKGLDLADWWILKAHGLTLFGTEAQTLPFEVDWQLLISRMRENMNTYWASFTQKPQRMAWLLTDYGVQWAVLGVLRQYYTFEEHAITSKVGAGRYALSHLPARWHRIIQEAINIREETAPSQYSLKLNRAIEAIRFVRFVIDSCNGS